MSPSYKTSFAERRIRSFLQSWLPNSRGGIIDEEALIRALEEKQIAGAGLDVFVEEPLPPDNKLWELPNVIISAHVSGDFEDYYMEGTRLFAENLRRYMDGKELLNVIDKELRYQTSGPKYHDFLSLTDNPQG